MTQWHQKKGLRCVWHILSPGDLFFLFLFFFINTVLLRTNMRLPHHKHDQTKKRKENGPRGGIVLYIIIVVTIIIYYLCPWQITMKDSGISYSKGVYILLFFVVNIYNKYLNFLLLKMWFISTVWKTTLYIVIFKFICFPL